jgi:signal transduction histidine kinase
MRRRVVTAIMTVSAIVLLLFAVPLAFVFERFVDDRAAIDLEHRVDVVARSVDVNSKTDPPDGTDFPNGTFTFALYAPDGTLTFGRGPARLEPQLRQSRTGATKTIELGGQLIAAAPVVSGENVTGIIRGQRSMRTVDRDTQRAIAGLTIGAVVVLAAGWLLARRLAAALGTATDQLSTAAQRLGSGDFTINVPTVGIAELDGVAASLNATAQRLDQLVTREQTFSSDVSHQLRTPLTGLRTAIETELAYPGADPAKVLREALDDITRIEQTVTDLLALARAERQHTTAFQLRPLLESTRLAWNGPFAQRGRPLTLSCPDTILAVGTPPLLGQALDALLDNALRHGGGPTQLAAKHDAGHITVTVTDRGLGLRSTTDDGSGVRLGLALVNRLIQAQGGRFINAPGGPNPTFQIILREPPPPDR